ncbi:MAG: T9SS type A sorting domain-containing protein [Bacteroidota bacterium]
MLALSTFLLVAVNSSLLAQGIPVYAYYLPAEFGDGDEVSIILKVGDYNNQVLYAQALQLKIPYDLFEIDANSEISQELGPMSWFGADGNYFGNQYVDHENREIVLHLFRTNGIPISGHGFTTRINGIIIEMEEILGKTQIEVGEVEISIMEDVRNKLGISWVLDASSDLIELQNFGDSKIEKVSIYNLGGQVVYEGKGEIRQISTSAFASQTYVMQVDTDQGSFSEKVWVK